MNQAGLKSRFVELHEKLEKLREEPYDRRAFLYLDIMSWLQSKIKGVSVESVIRTQFLERSGQSTGRMARHS
jgi:hypothetical protein